MATHSSVLAWRIPGTGEPGGLPSMGLHRVGHDWRDLAVAAAELCQVGLTRVAHVTDIRWWFSWSHLRPPQSHSGLLMTTVRWDLRGDLINNYTWPLHVTWHSWHRGLFPRTRVPRGSQKEASEVMLYYSLHILLLRSKSLKPLIFKGRRIMLHLIKGSSLVVQTVKNLSAIQETWVESLGWEDPLEKKMATRSSIFAWRIPMMEI